MQIARVLLLLLVALGACKHHPVTPPRQQTVSETTAADEVYLPYDSIILPGRIVHTYFHHFSDSIEQDSFAVEVPPGNIVGGRFKFSICNAKGELLYEDEIPNELYLGGAANNQSLYASEAVLDSFRKDIAHFLDLDNFQYSAGNGEVMHARADEIEDMVGWNEAVNAPRRMTFRYWANDYSQFHVAYSYKHSRGVVIVVTEYEY